MFVNLIKTQSRLVASALAARAYSSASIVKVNEQKVTVGTCSINYVQAALENSNPSRSLICLPGALGSAFTDFKPQIENLPKLLPDYQIIAWDPPGYGKSLPPNRNFTTDFLEKDADAANELMKTLNISKFSILGWSDGGITGLILAGKFPENVEKLLIFGSNAYIIEEELKVYDEIRDVSKWSAKMREPMEKLYGVDNFRKNWEAWVDVVKLIYKENGGDLCKQHLKHIKAQTLILHGEKDPMLAKEHVPYLLQNITRSRLISWPDGKHNIHLRYAEEFNKRVAEFLIK